MRFLITAGPTREYIDPVRYITNPASGRMGFSLARAARATGHKVILISGPTSLAPPAGIRFKQVNTAREMYSQVMKFLKYTDCLIMSAAVTDYRPRLCFKSKIKKTKARVKLELVRNPDILKQAGQRKRHQILVGFALEMKNNRSNALRKLKEKKLDYIILNTPACFGKDTARFEILGQNGVVKRFRSISKTNLSRFVIKLIEDRGRRKYGLD